MKMILEMLAGWALLLAIVFGFWIAFFYAARMLQGLLHLPPMATALVFVILAIAGIVLLIIYSK
jgi:hypothetical protein